jgi:hypothetical protein
MVLGLLGAVADSKERVVVLRMPAARTGLKVVLAVASRADYRNWRRYTVPLLKLAALCSCSC